MKKLFLSFASTFVFTSLLFAQGTGSVGSKFGNSNCTGFGLSCGHNGIQTMQNGLTLLNLSFSEKNNSLTMTIKETDLANTNPDALDYLQNHRSFTIQSSVPIESKILSNLNLSEGTVIPSGTYTITTENDGFVIIFNIKEE